MDFQEHNTKFQVDLQEHSDRNQMNFQEHNTRSHMVWRDGLLLKVEDGLDPLISMVVM